MTEVRWRVTLSLVMQTCFGTSAEIISEGFFGRAMKIRTNDLNFDIDLDELLRQGIYLNQAGIHCAVEPTELGNQTNVSLADGLVRIWANDAAWNGSEETNTISERVDLIAISNDMRYHRIRYILIDPYHPWVSAFSLSPTRVCA